MNLQCRLCGQLLVLNKDSEETREAGVDPYQQMRRHLFLRHLMETAGIADELGWLTDAMCFDSPDDPARYRVHIAKLVDHFLKDKKVVNT